MKVPFSSSSPSVMCMYSPHVPRNELHNFYTGEKMVHVFNKAKSFTVFEDIDFFFKEQNMYKINFPLIFSF